MGQFSIFLVLQKMSFIFLLEKNNNASKINFVEKNSIKKKEIKDFDY